MARVNEKTRKRIVRSDWLSVDGAPAPMANAEPPTPTTFPKEFRKVDLWFDYEIKL